MLVENINAGSVAGGLSKTKVDNNLLDISGLLRCLYAGNDLIGEYYGSDFSGVYYSWKLGKICLVALDGRGSFQGKINEEWLKSKGFEKKSV